MEPNKRKIRCHVNTREQRSSRKYRTLIITNKTAVVKRKRRTNFEVIKSFDIEQMAHFFANYHIILSKGRGSRVQAVKRFLESEAPI